jgi:uncharacterized protein (TIGR00369 family)
MKIARNVLDQLNDNPLYNTIGIRVKEAADGKALATLEPNAAVCWPFPGQPHGGILFTLMDTTMAWAVLSELDSGFNCTTVNFDIHFTSPANDNPFFCSAWITHRTGRLRFARADLQNANHQLVAMGQATFRIIQINSLK